MPFKIIKNHGTISFLAQICHFVTAIRVIIAVPDADLSELLVGAFLNALYISNIAFIFLLTLNRCDIMFGNKIMPRINRLKFYNYGLIACYIYTIILFLFYSYPDFNTGFSAEYYEWVFINNKDWRVDIALGVQSYSVWTFLSLSTFLYMAMFLKLLQLRGHTTRKSVISFNDFKLVIHALLCFASVALLEFFWSGILMNIYRNEITALIPEILFICVSGCNTIATFLFVREIRRDVIAFVCCHSGKNFQLKEAIKTRVTRI
uniref:7TM_GPCR_Srx domain-containing protein n=1 Tax=Parastrongyloides trichosuri TaxID=131310 RepID=A0A0N4ZA16_PARTI